MNESTRGTGCKVCGVFSWFLWRNGVCGTCCNAIDAIRHIILEVH